MVSPPIDPLTKLDVGFTFSPLLPLFPVTVIHRLQGLRICTSP